MEQAPEKIFAVGTRFRSYAELQDAVQRYQDKEYAQLCKRDCRTIANARRRTSGPKMYNWDLKYLEVSYVCHYSGKPFAKSKSKGLRVRQSIKSDCQFKLYLKVSEDGMCLVVKSLQEEHNHERSADLYNGLPINRLLFGESRKRAKDLLDQGVDKKGVQQLIFQETGKVIDVKILKNLASELREKRRRREIGDMSGSEDQESETEYNIKEEEEEELDQDPLLLTPEEDNDQKDNASLPQQENASFPQQDNASFPQQDNASFPQKDNASYPQQDNASPPPQSTPLQSQPIMPENFQVNYHNHYIVILEALANDDAFMDVTLTAQGQSVKAHKSVLSAVSPYFRDVLKANPCQHPIIIMPRDVRFEELWNIIQFIYRGEMTVKKGELASLLKTAEILQVSGLSTFHSALEKKATVDSGVSGQSEPKANNKDDDSFSVADSTPKKIASTPIPVTATSSSKQSGRSSNCTVFKRRKSDNADEYIDLKTEVVYDAQPASMEFSRASGSQSSHNPTAKKQKVLQEERRIPVMEQLSPMGDIHVYAAQPADRDTIGTSSNQSFENSTVRNQRQLQESNRTPLMEHFRRSPDSDFGNFGSNT